MPDMLVKLYDLDFSKLAQGARRLQEEHGIRILRVMAPNAHKVLDFIQTHFGEGWASEATAALYRSPVSCYAAVDADKQVLGFACYDATAKDFFGPTGVMESQRGKGIGAALLIACMQAMAAEGYAYAVIGGAGPVAFYEKVVGATVIPDSVPGPYRDMF